MEFLKTHDATHPEAGPHACSCGWPHGETLVDSPGGPPTWRDHADVVLTDELGAVLPSNHSDDRGLLSWAEALDDLLAVVDAQNDRLDRIVRFARDSSAATERIVALARNGDEPRR